MKKNNINFHSLQPAPKHLVNPLEVLADWLKTLGYEGEWLSNQMVLNIAIDAHFDETELATDEDQIFETLDEAFSKAPYIHFGRWEGQYRGDGPKRQHRFSLKRKSRKKQLRETTTANY